MACGWSERTHGRSSLEGISSSPVQPYLCDLICERAAMTQIIGTATIPITLAHSALYACALKLHISTELYFTMIVLTHVSVLWSQQWCHSGTAQSIFDCIVQTSNDHCVNIVKSKFRTIVVLLATTGRPQTRRQGRTNRRAATWRLTWQLAQRYGVVLASLWPAAPRWSGGMQLQRGVHQGGGLLWQGNLGWGPVLVPLD